MKDLLIVIMVIMLIYIYQTSYNNEYRINQLEKAILKLNEMNNKLKNELSIYRVRQVNWFSQYEIQSILISNDTIICDDNSNNYNSKKEEATNGKTESRED